MMHYSTIIARELIKINAFIYHPKKLFKYRIGILSPVYLDNRQILYHPKTWTKVMNTFISLINQKKIKFDVIGGLETTGMNFSTTLGYILKKPTVFIRKHDRLYGTKKRIEGGEVQYQEVLLVQDTITTGKSMIDAVSHLRDAGAVVNHCLVIDSQDFLEAEIAFEKAKVNLHILTTCRIIVKEALKMGKITPHDANLIAKWYADPYSWSRKYLSKRDNQNAK